LVRPVVTDGFRNQNRPIVYSYIVDLSVQLSSNGQVFCPRNRLKERVETPPAKLPGIASVIKLTIDHKRNYPRATVDNNRDFVRFSRGQCTFIACPYRLGAAIVQNYFDRISVCSTQKPALFRRTTVIQQYLTRV